MDMRSFDGIIRLLSTSPSRRMLLTLCLGGIFATHDISGTRAKKRRKKTCSPCQKKKKGKCKGPKPDGTPCPEGTCLGGLCTLLQSPPPPPDPLPRLDAECIGPADPDNYWNGDGARFAQSFTPLIGGQLVSAELVITKVADSIGDYVLQLTSTDANGAPTEASAFLANSAVTPGTAARSFTFSNPASVLPGAEYALVLFRTNNTRLEVGRLANPTCAGQAFINFFPAGGVFDPLPADLIYKTFVLSSP